MQNLHPEFLSHFQKQGEISHDVSWHSKGIADKKKSKASSFKLHQVCSGSFILN
jgi:hypothetical protein